MNEWVYYGCYRGTGHRLFLPGMQRPPSSRPWAHRLQSFDGLLAPQGDPGGYVAILTRLGGWNLSALAFWDYSEDTRPGSNSIFFAPGLVISGEDLLEGAKSRFGPVFARLPRPVTLI